MCGLFEFLFLLFSASEMMLTSIVKTLMVDTLRKQCSFTHMPQEDSNSSSPISVTASWARLKHSSDKPFSPNFRALPSIPQISNRTSILTTRRDNYSLPLKRSPNNNVTLPPSENKSSFPFAGFLNVKMFHPQRNHSYRVNSNHRDNSSVMEHSPRIPNTMDPSPATMSHAKTSPNNSLIHQDESLVRWRQLSSGGRSWSNDSWIPPQAFVVRSRNGTNGNRSSFNRDAGDTTEEDFQKKVSWYMMVDQICTYLPWVAVGPLFGAWIDKQGRKPFVALPCVFHVLAVLTYLLTSLRPERLLVIVVIGGLLRGTFGKHTMFATAITSMVSDLIPLEQKSTRFAILMGFRYAGICSGTLGASILLTWFGINNTLLMASALHVLCFFITILALKETRASPPPRPSEQNAQYISAIKTFLQIWRRPGPDEQTPMSSGNRGKEDSHSSDAPLLRNGRAECRTRSRARLCRILTALTLTFLTQSLWCSVREIGTLSVTLPPFEWPGSWFGYLYAAFYGTGGVVLLVLVPLQVRIWGRDADLRVIVHSVLCGACGCVWLGLAVIYHSSWQVFAASALASVGLSSNASCQSLVSKSVGPDVQATCIAVFTVVGNLGKLLGPVLHNAFCMATFSFSPSCVYFLMACEALLMLGIVRFMKKQDDYVVL